MLPHDDDAERALLGSIIISPRIFDSVVLSGVRSEHFYRKMHRDIFSCMQAIHNGGKEIDVIALRNMLSVIRGEDESTITAYLVELGDSVYSSERWRQYADIIMERAKYRSVIDICSGARSIAYEAKPGDADELLSNTISALNKVLNDGSDELRSIDDIAKEFKHSLYKDSPEHIVPPGLPTAVMEPGDLVVIAGGTSVGKTAVSMDWAYEFSKCIPVAYMEYEMDELSLFARLVCKNAGVTMIQLKNRDLNSDELARVNAAIDEIRKNKLYIEEVWCDINALVARIRRMVHQNGVKVVFIDHLGLIPFNRPKGMNEAKAVGYAVTNVLKRLAVELGIIIVLLVQLNREGQKNGIIPRLYHLRDSGEIEQDASIIIMLWSEASVRDDFERKYKLRVNSGILDDDELMDESFTLFKMYIEKNRNNPLSETWLKYYGDTFSFEYPAGSDRCRVCMS